MGIKTINDSTYRLSLAEDDVEIGDIKANTFRPHLNLKRWGGECHLNVWLGEQGTLTAASTSEIVWRNGSKQARVYALAPNDQHELGGVELEIDLLEKPTSNVVTLNIESQGLKFYYQPPLTAEYSDGWSDEFQDTIKVTETQVVGSKGQVYVYRPENVVGSYAVYHESKRDNKYKTGKAFHIYRPRIEDADGKWVWGELNIDPKAGTFTVTIPQAFLDTAKYPIRHASGATFGYTTKGGGYSVTFYNDYIRGAVDTPSESGTGDSVVVYLRAYGSTASKVKCAVYRVSDSALLGYTEQWTVTSGWDDWKTLNFTSVPDISTVPLIPVAWADGWVYGYYDSGSEGDGKYDRESYGAWPNPASFTDFTSIPSVYCEYTPDAIIVTPVAATFVSASTDPTVVLGSITLSPSASLFILAGTDPTVDIGSGGTIISPDAANFVAASIAPSVILGSVTLSPAATAFVVASTAPSVILGGISLAPGTIAFVATTSDPNVVLGSITLSPATADFVAASVDPTVLISDVVVTPTTVGFVTTTIDPSVLLGPIIVTAPPSDFVVAVTEPEIILGSIILSPTTVDVILEATRGPVVGSPETRIRRIDIITCRHHQIEARYI